MTVDPGNRGQGELQGREVPERVVAVLPPLEGEASVVRIPVVRREDRDARALLDARTPRLSAVADRVPGHHWAIARELVHCGMIETVRPDTMTLPWRRMQCRANWTVPPGES